MNTGSRKKGLIESHRNGKTPQASEKPRQNGMNDGSSPGVGAPKGSRNHLVHGHYPRRAALMKLGFERFVTLLDQRTVIAQEYQQRRDDIYSDLGGEDQLSRIQKDL